MFGKLLLIFILALQLLILTVLYVNNPKSFSEAVSKLDPTDSNEDKGGDEGEKEGGGEGGSGEEGSGLLETHTNFSKKLADY